MQRLLTILENARNLPEQLTSLDGIVLDQYGAYYASRYEGFTEVHPIMGFNYHPNANFNAQPFNPNLNLYRVTIESIDYEAKKARDMIGSLGEDWVIRESKERLRGVQDKTHVLNYLKQKDDLPADYHLYSEDYSTGWLTKQSYKRDDTLPITNKKFEQLVYRYVGQQHAGITIQSLDNESQFWNAAIIRDVGGFRIRLAQTLLFVTSDRYKGVTNNRNNEDENTFQAIMGNTDRGFLESEQNISTTFARLKELQANHISFSDQEALFYQSLQKNNLSINLHLSAEELVNFYFKRVAGLPEKFARYQESEKNKPGGGKPLAEVRAELFWFDDAHHNFRERLHHYLLNNKPAALKFINLVGPYHIKETGVFLYAFNTDAFFSEIPQITQTFRDDLLAFSAQLVNPTLNLIPSDFSNVIKSTDKDIVQLKKIRDYLYQSTLGDPLQNYLYYTITRLMDANIHFSYQQVLTIFEEVSQLKSTSDQLDTTAVHAILEKNGVPVCIKVAQTLERNDQFVKESLIAIQIIIEFGLPVTTDEEQLKHYSEKAGQLTQELESLTIAELQERFTSVLPTANLAVKAAVAIRLKELLKVILHKEISHLFEKSNEKLPEFTQYWIESIEHLQDLQELKDFVAVDKSVDKVQPLALAFTAIIKNPSVIEHQDDFIKLFSTLNFAQLDTEIVLHWFDFLSEMPQRNYLPLLTAMMKHPEIIYQKNTFKALVHLLKKLNAHEFSTDLMVAFYHRFAQTPTADNAHYDHLINQLAMHLAQNNKDPIVALCLIEPNFSLPQDLTISKDTHQFNLHREQLATLYKALQQTNQLDEFLALNVEPNIKPMMLKILALAYSGRRPADPPPNFLYVVQQLQALDVDQLTALDKHYDSTLTSIHCLSNALKRLKKRNRLPNS